MWKNMVQPDRPWMTIQHGACALHARYLRLQTHTQNFRELSNGKVDTATMSKQREIERMTTLRSTDFTMSVI